MSRSDPLFLPMNIEKFMTNLYYLMPPFEPRKSTIFKTETEQFSMGIIQSAKGVKTMLILSLKAAEKSKSDLIEPQHMFSAIYLSATGKLRQLLAQHIAKKEKPKGKD